MRGKSIYADLYVKYSHRALRTPRVSRPWRPRVIAWAGPTAFMRDRFYELDSWYKARIHKPELLPQLYLIDPDKINYTLQDRLTVPKSRKINIGFKQATKKNLKAKIYDDDTLEKLSRRNLLEINLEDILFDDLNLIEHYQIFEDIFAPGVYFYNTQKFSVNFATSNVESDSESNEDSNEEKNFLMNTPFFGNVISADVMRDAPNVHVERFLDWSKESGSRFSTLLMLNIDGDAFTERGTDEKNHLQILHWMAANIPDARLSDEITSFETIVPYLPPTPFYGTGYHRVAFILFRHAERIDFSTYFASVSTTNDAAGFLSRRFDTNIFTKYFEKVITPSALKFCQVKWDASCDETLHKLGLKSPRYWYEWNERLKPEQKEFPIKPMSFHHYLNMFRPPEKVRREIAQKRLEMLMNQEETEGEKVEKPEYPDMFYQENIKRMSNWIHRESIRKNVGWGPYAALYNNYVNPAEQHTMPPPHTQSMSTMVSSKENRYENQAAQ